MPAAAPLGDSQRLFVIRGTWPSVSWHSYVRFAFMTHHADLRTVRTFGPLGFTRALDGRSGHTSRTHANKGSAAALPEVSANVYKNYTIKAR